MRCASLGWWRTSNKPMIALCVGKWLLDNREQLSEDTSRCSFTAEDDLGLKRFFGGRDSKMRFVFAATEPIPDWLMIVTVFLISSLPAIACFLGAAVWWGYAAKSRTLYRPILLILLGIVWIFFFVPWLWLLIQIWNYFAA